MRIRKHASKILGTASTSQQQHSSPPPETAAYSSWVKQAYSCEVNRSMWDVFPFPPLCSEDYSDKEAEQEKMRDADEIEEAAAAAAEMSAMTSHTSSSCNTAELKLKEEEPAASTEEEYILECKKPKKKFKKANKGRKTADAAATTTTTTIVRTVAKKEESEYIQSTYTCKKTDGKQWRCKVPVNQPNSLCDYHLDQLLSYRCSSNTTRKARRPAPVRKTTIASSRSRSRQKRPRTSAVESTGSESMYYNSVFGPWRGKQRGGEPAVVEAEVKEESEEEQQECHRSSRDDDDDDDDDSEEDSLEEDSEEENQQKLNSRKKKKKRRPVKARSLKSLL